MRLLALPIAISVLSLGSLAYAPVPRITPFAALRGVHAEMAVPVPGTNRIYYSTAAKELWLYDRATKQTKLIARGEFGSVLNVSPNGDRLFFSRASEDGKQKQLWSLPFDVKTGLASGAARRLAFGHGWMASLSPDGSRVAYVRHDDEGNTEDLVVIPAVGGPEQVVQRVPGGILPVRWSPDGRWLYYGVEGMRVGNTRMDATFRVSADSGSAQQIAKTSANWPGLSPDGRLLAVTRDTCDTLLIAEPSGRELGRFALTGAGVGGEWYHWSSNTRFMVFDAETSHPLVSMSLADATSRVISSATDDGFGGPMEFSWSPDGRRVAAVFQYSSGGILIMNADGSNKRRFRTRERWPLNLTWSPDGKFIAYSTGFKGALRGLNVMDAESGRETQLGHANLSNMLAAWSSDSRSVFWSAVDDSISLRKNVIPRVLLSTPINGAMRAIRTDTVSRLAGLVPVGAGAEIGVDSTGDVFVRQNRESVSRRVARLGAGFSSIPAFSSDAHWVAFRRNPGSTDPTRLHVLEVFRLDGSQRVSIDLPFLMLPGPNNPTFLADPSKVVVTGRESPTAETRCYTVDLKTREITKINASIATRRSAPNIACHASPDGKTLLVSTEGETVTTFADVDVSDFASRVASTKHQQ